MPSRGFIRRTATAGILAGSLALGLVGVAASSSSASQTGHSACAPGATSANCTVNVAWGPGTFATNIFPFYSGSNFSVSNISDLQELLYRPLYWYGKGTSIAEVNALSPGNAPTFPTSHSVTFTIKPGWTYTNHAGAKEQLNAQSVIFFLNMYKAEPHEFGDFTPGYGIPDQVTNVTKNSNLSVTITFNSVLSHNWLILNMLSSINPMPVAWDITATGHAPGSGACSTAAWNSPALVTNCQAVWTYLNAESNDYSTYNNLNSLWGWDSGPFRLKSFGLSGGAPDGNQVLIPNTGYSGPASDHSHMGQISWTPFTTEGAEVVALKAGHIDIGYAPESDVTAAKSPGSAGTNLASAGLGHYKVQGTTEWGFSYAYVNFGITGTTHKLPAGVIRSELNMAYIRDAMLQGENQASIVKNIYKNYGVPANLGPVPVIPKNNYGKGVTYPWGYSISKGKATLQAHGFVNGVCTRAGAAGCGTAAFPIGIGSHINFTYEYSSGDPQFQAALQAEQAAWHSEGINVTLDPQTANQVVQDCFVGNAAWEFCQYGGWIYFPDFYPTAEGLWHTNSGANFGGYDSNEMNALIAGTTNDGNFPLNANQGAPYHTSFLAYALSQVPYLFQPTELGPAELSKSIVGALAPSPLADFMPETITSK